MTYSEIYVPPKRWTIDEVLAEDKLAVSIDDVKESARMDKGDTMLDDTIERYIKAVQNRVESYCGLTIFRTRFVGWYDSFPVVFSIRKRPFRAVDSIDYVGPKDELKTLDSGVYQVQEFKHDTNVFLNDGRSYPPIKRFKVDSVRIKVEAGWDSSEDVPEEIKSAIIVSVVKMLQGDCGDNNVLTKGAIQLLRPYRNSMNWLRN